MPNQADTEQDATQKELLAQAAELDIEGRTSMNKKELQEAIDNTLAGDAELPKAGDEPAFDRDRLIAESQAVVGCPPHILVGALHDVKGKGPVTVAQASAAVDGYLNRAVREDA